MQSVGYGMLEGDDAGYGQWKAVGDQHGRLLWFLTVLVYLAIGGDDDYLVVVEGEEETEDVLCRALYYRAGTIVLSLLRQDYRGAMHSGIARYLQVHCNHHGRGYARKLRVQIRLIACPEHTRCGIL